MIYSPVAWFDVFSGRNLTPNGANFPGAKFWAGYTGQWFRTRGASTPFALTTNVGRISLFTLFQLKAAVGHSSLLLLVTGAMCDLFVIIVVNKNETSSVTRSFPAVKQFTCEINNDEIPLAPRYVVMQGLNPMKYEPKKRYLKPTLILTSQLYIC